MPNRVEVIGAPGGAAGELAKALEEACGKAFRIVCRLDSGEAGSASFEAPQACIYVAAAGDRTGRPQLQHAAGSFSELLNRPPRHLIVISSAAVYPPNAHHPGMAAETHRFSPRRANTISEGWRNLESWAQKLTPRIPAVTVLRPAPVLTAKGQDYFSRIFRAPWAAIVPGYDPPLQLTSVSDVARAVAACLEQPKPGFNIYNLAPAAVIRMRKALAMAGTRALPVPRFIQSPLRKLLSAAGRCWPSEQIDYLRYNWTVSGERLHQDLGFAPELTSAEALRAALGGSVHPAADEVFDDFGMDRSRIDALGRSLFRFLHDHYWRVETRGLEQIPSQGAAVLVGLHRGFMPFDGIMMLHAAARWRRRYPRFLVHAGLLKAPFSSSLIMTLGGIPACRENAERILSDGGLLGVFPEGVRGAFAPYRQAYRLQRFDLEFVRLALEFQVPLIPFVTVGSAETFPILARLRAGWLRRRLEWPCLPLTPTFPLLPLPLPSKWHTWVLPRIEVRGRYPAEAARDQQAVRELGAEVRRKMEQAVAWILQRRPSWFHGSVFGTEEPKL